MVNLYLAAGFFLGIHLFVAGTRLRGLLIGRLGRSLYLVLFSLASIVGLIWLISAYGAASQSPASVMAIGFPLPEWVTHLGVVVMAAALPLAVIGLTTPNPTSVGLEGMLERDDAVRGVLRITRHPFLWAVLIWAAFHFLLFFAKSDLAASVLFGTFVVLAAAGTISIDAKRRAALGENWEAFAKATSNVPFAAILGGRQAFRPTEIRWWQWLAGLGAFALIFYGHKWIFGASPVPGWTPY